MLTLIEDPRPGKAMLGMKCCAESDAQVENTQLLHLNLKTQENQLIMENIMDLYILDCLTLTCQ